MELAAWTRSYVIERREIRELLDLIQLDDATDEWVCELLSQPTSTTEAITSCSGVISRGANMPMPTERSFHVASSSLRSHKAS
ncbi:Uncharacterised protein [uncultured archaeon]|nr:Uncharacterised protein [uncultured archaeon]